MQRSSSEKEGKPRACGGRHPNRRWVAEERPSHGCGPRLVGRQVDDQWRLHRPAGMGLGEGPSRATVYAGTYSVGSHCAHLCGVNLQGFCVRRKTREVYGVPSAVGRRSGGHYQTYCRWTREASARGVRVLIWDSRRNRRCQDGVCLLQGGVRFPNQVHRP